MNVDELIDTMHATHVTTPLDLDRVTRDGRRLRGRRRAAMAGGLAVAVAAVAIPVGLWEAEPPPPSRVDFAGAPQAPADETAAHQDVERAFLSDAPVGDPLGVVVQPGRGYTPKFYLGHRGGSSMGALALWGEQGGLAFGARLIDGDGSLRRAGVLDLPDLSGDGATLVRVPFQGAQEATFVGLVRVPEGIDPGAISSGVESVHGDVATGVRVGVVPGRVLVWVTATSPDGEPLDFTGFTISNGRRVIASGGFEVWRPGTWAPAD